MPTLVHELRLNLPLMDYAGSGVSVRFVRDEPSSVYTRGMIGDRRELGLYRYVLSQAQMDDLERWVMDCDLWRLPRAKYLTLDVPWVSISEVAPGESAPRHEVAWSMPDLPLTVRSFLDKVRPLIDAVREHPWRVLSGTASWQHGTQRPDEPLQFGFTLKNIGQTPLEIIGPASQTSADSYLTLIVDRTATRPRARKSKLPAGGALRVPSRNILIPAEGSPARTPSNLTLHLEASESASFTAHIAARIAPGTYRAVLLLNCMTSEMAAEEVVTLKVGGAPERRKVLAEVAPELQILGRLTLDLGPLFVTP